MIARKPPPPAPLFAPHVAGSQTSRDAARAIEPRADTLRRLVLDAITRAGDKGLTDLEGEAATGIGGSTYRPRRVELADGQLIEIRGTRVTPSGRAAAVWVRSDT